MASQVIPGRFTAQVEGPFVVFLIGMRINNLFAIRQWLPTASEMGPMLRTLYQHPEKGFLGGELFFYGRGVMLMQYWRSFEDLERFARDRNDPHFAAWQRFNKRVGYSKGMVGIFHETYQIDPGKSEAIYGNMPVFGLAAATQHVRATGGLATARRRLGGQNEPAVPTPDAQV